MKLLLAVTLLTGACTSPQARKHWSNAQKSDQEFYRDTADCEAQANSTGVAGYPRNLIEFGAAIDSAGDRTALYERCMKGRGWTLWTD